MGRGSGARIGDRGRDSAAGRPDVRSPSPVQRRFCSSQLGGDGRLGVRHGQQALLRDRLARDAADAVGLVLDALQRAVEVADERLLPRDRGRASARGRRRPCPASAMWSEKAVSPPASRDCRRRARIVVDLGERAGALGLDEGLELVELGVREGRAAGGRFQQDGGRAGRGEGLARRGGRRSGRSRRRSRPSTPRRRSGHRRGVDDVEGRRERLGLDRRGVRARAPPASAGGAETASAMRSETAKPASLRSVLDAVDELAGHALGAERVVERRVERDRAP